MRLYTLFTESHQALFQDYFLPSLVPGEYLLTAEQFAQDDFAEVVRGKMHMCARACQRGRLEGDEFFVFSDCDVQFFGRTKEALVANIGTELELVAQNDNHVPTRPKTGSGRNGGRICTGFFIARTTLHMQNFFEEVARQITNEQNDQHVVNRLRSAIKYKLIGKRFWSPRHNWRPGAALNIPDDILMHHANWTSGVQNKMRMLEKVRRYVWARRDRELIKEYGYG